MRRSMEQRRQFSGPILFKNAFRPFFLGGAVYAALALPVWLLVLDGTIDPSSITDPLVWHSHEMTFGYLGAILAGFLLTAIPNWTGRLPVIGGPLAALAGLWALGRVAMAAQSWLGEGLATTIDVAFLIVLAVVATREVVAGGNRRNLPVCGLLALVAAANVLSHWEMANGTVNGYGLRLGLGTVAMLLALIGGRIVPSFTRNWLARRNAPALPAPFGPLDKAALLSVAVALAAWVAVPASPITGGLLLAAGAVHLARLARWRGLATLGEPLVWVLHLGYAWLAVALILMGAAAAWPEGIIAPATALHALTAGAIGTMTIAVMTRASLGHSGQPLTADRMTTAIYVLIVLGGVVRVLAPALDTLPISPITLAGGLWSAGFVLFALHYGPLLCRRRA